MGICYTLHMYDDLDWAYKDTSKEEQLKEFSDKYGGHCELQAQWPYWAIFDVDKQRPWTKERVELIRQYATMCYVTDDRLP